ncbi:aminotransferase class IV [Dictyobacter kobayashii]|uniref:Branched chain amino acid aminotransferase n=1 Tax=Dictyobacter kobayashii TaxID=2014872 RepID=A0A402AB52_9CHLR|nr:aminotransferase class IV [Dictyobacter kobayashii]GCE16394.1 branched chain amino acid aminotransferase [Dictyobacter kobayashii]
MDEQAWWYINGNWVHPHEASISINDVAVLRGYSVFESLRTYHRRPFHLDEHLQRLYRSARLIELDVTFAAAFLHDIVLESIERNPYEHATVRLLVTGGVSEDGVLPYGDSGLAVMVTPLAERDMERFARGCKLITTNLTRMMPEAKTANYVSAIRALKEAAQQQASDALFVNEQRHVLEGTRSNFFIFHGDTLVTPQKEVLIGVTRNVVLELARGRFTIEERPILIDELGSIDEAFITSSSKEITPVIQINDLVIGDGKPGTRTYELEQHFIKLVEQGQGTL